MTQLMLDLTPVQSVVTECQGASVRNRNRVKRKIKPRLSGQRAIVLDYFVARGERGATREEVALGLCMLLQSVCGRSRELIDMEELLETNQKRPTRSGETAVVLVAKSVMEWQFLKNR